MKAPWDYSPEVTPENATLNLPTPEGRELGAEMARLFGSEDCCHDCAFRLGTLPNGCAPTLMDALKCGLEGDPFLCHVTGRACAGWVAMRKAREEE